MKKIFITLFFCVTALSVTAQKKVSWGVRGGVNIGELKSSSLYHSNTGNGINVGVQADFHFKKKFSFQGELNYYTHNSKAKVGFYGGDGLYNTEYKLSFIQLPILIKYNFLNWLSFEIGPAFNFLIDGESIIYSSYGNIIDTTGVVRDFQISGAIGTTYTFENGIFGGLRYHHSIGDVNNKASRQKLVRTHFFVGMSF
mgnify:CR=1 FL=1